MSNSRIKTERVLAALEHRETDRVPVGEIFWSNFIKRVRKEMDVGPDFNPYLHWDLDLIILNPNMDPQIRGIEVVENSPERRVVKTGFGATIEQRADYPMPHFADFETQSFEQMEAFEFDDPHDPRRYYEAVDDLINSVTDTLNLGLPPWIERVNSCVDDLCVFGGVCEPHEMIWRMAGTENILMKMGEDPGRLARFIERLGDFLVGITEAQIAAADGKLSGIYVWGDIAYGKGMFFSPDYWRQVYKPQLKRICDTAHAAGLKTIYHGCGNASAVFEDMIEAGVDAYNPLEVKAGLDVVELKRKYRGRWAFNGNIDVRVLARGEREEIRREVLTKLNAAKDGGYILQSDHSIPSDVAPESYDYMIQLVREYGQYPLELGEYDIDT
jgi:uroporphyrinogen-III decarboxylase